MIVPRDTTANRPSTPVNGMIRYSADQNVLETYANASWQTVSTSQGATSFTNDITMSGANTGLAVTNTETVGGNLTVTGTSMLNGAATVGGAATFNGANTGLAVTNTATVGGSLTVTGASSLKGGATMGAALNMNNFSITSVGAGIIGNGAMSIAAGGTNQNLTLGGSGTGSVLLNPNVGIGVTPDSPITYSDDTGNIQAPGANWGGTDIHYSFNNNYRFLLDGYGSNYALLSFRMGSGSVTAPTAVGSAGVLGGISAGGYGASQWMPRSAFITFQDQLSSTWTNASTPTEIDFWTTPSGSTGASIAERLTIQAGGNVGVGTTTASYLLDVYGDVNIKSTNALRIGGTSMCTTAGCTPTSDRTVKENIKPLTDSLDNILKLQGVNFDYIDKTRFPEKHQIGVIAQDVEKVYPEVVIMDKLTGLRSVAYDRLVAPVIEAIKTLYHRITGIEAHQVQQDREIANVKAENEKLKSENAQIKAYLCAKDPKAPICK